MEDKLNKDNIRLVLRAFHGVNELSSVYKSV